MPCYAEIARAADLRSAMWADEVLDGPTGEALSVADARRYVEQ